MTVYGISMVRDEADIIGSTLRRMADQVDAMIVADNLSSDGTWEILHELAGTLPIEVVADDEPGYYQAVKMTHLAHVARQAGASWVVPFDADEVWRPVHGVRLADVLESLPPTVTLADAALFDHRATALDDADEADPVARMRWRNKVRTPLPKVACRARPGLSIGMGNHVATHPGTVRSIGGLIEIRHFPYRSVEQFARKAVNGAAAYAATDLPDEYGSHWRGYGTLIEQDPAHASNIFHRWFHSSDPPAPPPGAVDEPGAGLVEDPVDP